MSYLQLCVLLTFTCHLFAVPSCPSNESVEAFIDMVLGNLTAGSSYVLPTDNSKLTYVSPSQENIIYDFGTFDFVIVGAGSAGTLLANRLTEIKKWKVLLLEAGGQETDFSDIPGMATELYVSDMNWGYLSTPQKRACKDYGTFDFIIVGAGSAGTLLANRLTEIEEWNVLLLEAGGEENDFSDIPGMATELYVTDMNWGYFTTSQKRACKGMNQSMCACPRGKVVGGSSTINGKMYVRGNKADYDEWEKMGNPGWSYKDVLPYFIKTENSHILHKKSAYRGTSGLLDVNYTDPTAFTSVFLKAKKELGYKVIDYNGKNQIGASQIQFTINGNKIASGGRAFIDPFLNRKNLNVTINAFVTGLLIENDTKTALGVEFIKDGKKYETRAKREVILSAGAINTPQILMISGIGPKEELDKIGVETLVDLPVGKALQDHPGFIGINIRTNQTLFNESVEILLQDYLNNHRPYTAPFNGDSLAFMNVNNDSSSVPDIQQILITPPGSTQNGRRIINLKEELVEQLEELAEPYNNIIMWVILLNPKSKGNLTLKSNNPLDFPNIDYNYYSEEKDLTTMLKGINETLKLLETDAFKSVNATYVSSYNICTNYTEGTDKYWRCMVEQLTTTIYHPIGTTRMGKSSNDSVVCSKLYVHGMNRLRVVDAGVMPKIPSGNTNAATYMVAEKAAHEIKCYWKGNDTNTCF